MGKALTCREIKLASLQLPGISAELLFRSLALLNVQTRPIPFDDVPISIAKRHFPVEHPAVFPIRSADARFVPENFSRREGTSPCGYNPVEVLRVNESRPLPPGHGVQSDSQVFQPRPIEIIEIAVRTTGMNQRWDRVDKKLNI